MTTIQATVIKHSVTRFSHPALITLEVVYPRAAVDDELLTHRVFSRNSTSSRAIPVGRMMQNILSDPALPVEWGKEQKGMQSYERLDDITAHECDLVMLEALNMMTGCVARLTALGAHKQFANLLLRPWEHTRRIITSTEWDNFFQLRLDPAAKPDFRRLAEAMGDAIARSTPQTLAVGEWHLPYVLPGEMEQYGGLTDPRGILRQLSTARCARVSYRTQDDVVPRLDQDCELHDRLQKQRHLSPFEHAASPDELSRVGDYISPDIHGNLKGYVQYRKLVEMSPDDPCGVQEV